MLPVTKKLHDHPRTQQRPGLAEVIELIADWDEFIKLQPEQLAVCLGMLSGALLAAYDELDRREVKH